MVLGRPVGVVLFLSVVVISECLNGELPSAVNLTCCGYSRQEYVCTWDPGDQDVEYFARWREERDRGFWRDCRNNNPPNTCTFYGEITQEREVVVQPKKYNGTTKSTVKTLLDFNHIIPLPPRNLVVLTGERPEHLAATWMDSRGFRLNNQLYFRLRYRPHGTDQQWIITPEMEGHEYLFNGLYAFTLYEIQIQARYHSTDIYGNWSSPVHAKTKEGVPSGFVPVLPMVEYKNKAKDTHRDVLISWMELPKQDWRGILLGYEIRLDDPEKATKPFRTSVNETSLLIQELKRNINYTAYIAAYNSMGATKPSAIAIPVSDVYAEPESWFTYIVILVCVTTVLLLSCVCWKKIKKFKNQMEPLPEPRFFKLEISNNQQTSKPQYERETFDELRTKPATPKMESKVFLDVANVDCENGNEDNQEISTYSVVKEY